MVVPRFPDDRLVLVRQFRHLNERESIEFPAGGIKPRQDVRGAAEAELREEAGFAAAAWREIGSFNPFNGVTDELCTVFLAEELSPCAAVPDETEEFEVLHCTKDEIRAMIADGRLWDGMSLAAWSLYLAGSTEDE
jgi:8-oxo-dGTP pyrophosphatase MutT (NUDIX family)